MRILARMSSARTTSGAAYANEPLAGTSAPTASGAQKLGGALAQMYSCQNYGKQSQQVVQGSTTATSRSHGALPV